MKKNLLLLGTCIVISTTTYAQSGNVGINTSNPQAMLHIDGGKDNPTTGAPSAAQEANDVVVTSAGRLGIGTINPGVSMQAVGGIAGGTAFGVSGTANVNNLYLELTANTTLPAPNANGQLLFIKNNAASTITLTKGYTGGLFDTYSSTSATSLSMLPLGHIAFVGYVQGGNVGWIAQVSLDSSNTPNNYWNVKGNAGTTPANNYIGTTDNQDFVVRTNNTEKMRVQAGGNVGIAVTTPTATLDVNGTARVRNTPVLSSGINSPLFVDVNGNVGKANPTGEGDKYYATANIASGATGTVISGLPDGAVYKAIIKVLDGCGSVAIADFWVFGTGFNNLAAIQGIGGATNKNGVSPPTFTETQTTSQVVYSGIAGCADGGNNTALNYTVSISNGPSPHTISITNNGNVLRTYSIVVERLGL
ncbi:hypothetical protein SAMN05880574_1413 [Chryseobacterium sp. RU37D]|uniref:hypothetical protein n=1 Tax=Chryseobacterium sp. RU37D TaxID=1907397 RepID=UPI000954D889|nr:hypothetical protein [Chryseobacterium sp. RU37D]SIQ96837.1 hypothetical protein SAMN05880574_1413 [Chryseobacterium sp. RU37D]